MVGWLGIGHLCSRRFATRVVAYRPAGAVFGRALLIRVAVRSGRWLLVCTLSSAFSWTSMCSTTLFCSFLFVDAFHCFWSFSFYHLLVLLCVAAFAVPSWLCFCPLPASLPQVGVAFFVSSRRLRLRLAAGFGLVAAGMSSALVAHWFSSSRPFFVSLGFSVSLWPRGRYFWFWVSSVAGCCCRFGRLACRPVRLSSPLRLVFSVVCAPSRPCFLRFFGGYFCVFPSCFSAFFFFLRVCPFGRPSRVCVAGCPPLLAPAWVFSCVGVLYSGRLS